MIRHSLNYFLAQLVQEQPMRFDKELVIKAIQCLNSDEFHKRLRTGFNVLLEVAITIIIVMKPIKETS